MSKLTDKVAAAKEKIAAKKQKGRAKMNEKAKRCGGANDGGTVAARCDPPVGRRDSAAAVMLCAAAAVLCAGCALERADPAARSNRTTYGAISVVASGDGASVTLTIGDGTIASADGEGAVTQPATQTAEQSPDVTVPGDAAGAVVTGLAHLGGKAIDALAAKGAGASARAGAGAGGSQFTATEAGAGGSQFTATEAGAACKGGDCAE